MILNLNYVCRTNGLLAALKILNKNIVKKKLL